MKFLASFAFLFLFSLYSHSETISEIKITGLNNISRGTVLNYLPAEVGDEFSLELESKIKNSLLKTNLFKDVKVNFSKGIFDIQTIENPTVKYFDFLGYKEDLILNSDQIIEIKKNFNLSAGSIYNESSLNKLLMQLKKLYLENGFYNVKLDLNKSIDEKNLVGIELRIEENEPSLISKMIIKGNKLFESDELLDLFSIGEPDFFLINYFTEKDRFNLLEFKSGLEKLKSKYFELGYIDFKIIKQEVILKKDTSLFINIEIDEGEVYKIGKIILEGDFLNLTHEKIINYLGIKSGDNLIRKNILNGSDKVLSLFHEKGYAYAGMQTQVVPSNIKNTVDLKIIFDKDKQIYVNRILIKGNNKTQDDVIRREFKIAESGIFNKQHLDESIKKIKRLGYFSDVKDDIKRLKDNDDKVDIEIDVTEAKTGEVSVGLSHSNAAGAAVNAGIKQKNILGTGNTLNFAFSNSSAVEELSFFFSTPYFNSEKTTLSYGFFDKTLDAKNIDASSYLLSETGYVLGYGINIDENSKLYSELRSSFVDISCGSALQVYEASDCSENSPLDLNLSISLDTNTLNDFFYPTEGVNQTLKFTTSLPVSDIYYYKFLGNFRTYTPVNEDYTFKFSSRLNYASGYGGDTLPFYKRFYEGGSSSVRGFNFNSLGPKYSNNKPKGGEISFISTTAISTPFNTLFNTKNENMFLGAFIDAGFLSDKVSTFDTNDIRASAGLQFSWITPIGPISLHYASPVLKKTDDEIENLSFQLGANF